MKKLFALVIVLCSFVTGCKKEEATPDYSSFFEVEKSAGKISKYELKKGGIEINTGDLQRLLPSNISLVNNFLHEVDLYLSNSNVVYKGVKPEFFEPNIAHIQIKIQDSKEKFSYFNQAIGVKENYVSVFFHERFYGNSGEIKSFAKKGSITISPLVNGEYQVDALVYDGEGKQMKLVYKGLLTEKK